MLSYELEERIAIMDLPKVYLKQAEMFASIDLDNKPPYFNDDDWYIIKTNTDKCLYHIDDFIINQWTPLVLFGVLKENGLWQGLLFKLPIKATIIKIDRMFIDYKLPNSNEIHHLIKSHNLNAKLFWKI